MWILVRDPALSCPASASAARSRTSSSRIWPEVGCSNPAISRKVVVLPQPEGPSREKNSPLATVRSMLSTAISLNFLVSPQLDVSSGHGAS